MTLFSYNAYGVASGIIMARDYDEALELVEEKYKGDIRDIREESEWNGWQNWIDENVYIEELTDITNDPAIIELN